MRSWTFLMVSFWALGCAHSLCWSTLARRNSVCTSPTLLERAWIFRSSL